MYTSRAVLKDLGRDSPELESIQQSYLHASDDITTIFFYEAYPTPIYGWLSQMVSCGKLPVSMLVDSQIDCTASLGHHTRREECGGGFIERGPRSDGEIR
jgi:hypothetical protein